MNSYIHILIFAINWLGFTVTFDLYKGYWPLPFAIGIGLHIGYLIKQQENGEKK